MQQILKFFIKNKVGVLFLVLFSLSIALTVQAHSYHNSKWISSTSFITSSFLNLKYDIISYFNLKTENQNLHYQNELLLKQLSNLKSDVENLSTTDSLYTVVKCHVISNSYDKIDNYVLIDVGTEDGVQEGYGVSLPNGIMGIVEKSNSGFSRVISILNTNLSINAKLKGSNQFGSLKSNARSYEQMNLEDIPRSASFSIGDTIVTGSNSLIFPENLPIGIIESFNLNDNSGYYNIEVKLFTDMTDLNHAYVILPLKIQNAKKLLDQNE
jgi:rod shape-determining protein MreC